MFLSVALGASCVLESGLVLRSRLTLRRSVEDEPLLGACRRGYFCNKSTVGYFFVGFFCSRF